MSCSTRNTCIDRLSSLVEITYRCQYLFFVFCSGKMTPLPKKKAEETANTGKYWTSKNTGSVNQETRQKEERKRKGQIYGRCCYRVHTTNDPLLSAVCVTMCWAYQDAPNNSWTWTIKPPVRFDRIPKSQCS